MNAFTSTKALLAGFARDEEGSQVVEYALVIALVSIFVIGLLRTAFSGTTNPFTALVNRISACLAGTGTNCS